MTNVSRDHGYVERRMGSAQAVNLRSVFLGFARAAEHD